MTIPMMIPSKPLHVTYDPASNAAYIYFKHIEEGGVAFTYFCDTDETHAEINLDFDKDGVLLGVEVFDAREKLPKELLSLATKI